VATDPSRSAPGPVRPDEVRPGDLLAFTYYTRVQSVSTPSDDGHVLDLVDLDAGEAPFRVKGDSLIARASSADQSAETRSVTRTECARLLVGTEGRAAVFTVCFDRADGTERTLRGRYLEQDEHLGRSRVEDLDRPPGDRIRLVDHRTLKWLIVDGIRYVVRS
jgi:hypothetical protein